MMLYQTLDPVQIQNWRDMLRDPEEEWIIRDLIDGFLSESATQLAVLHAALDIGDSRACRFPIHRLQSGCAVIGAQRMMGLCAEMEALANTESPALSELRQLLIEINEEYRRVTEALQRERP